MYSRLGDGLNTSAWFDFWNANGPMREYISSRNIHIAGFNLQSRVADVWREGAG